MIPFRSFKFIKILFHANLDSLVTPRLGQASIKKYEGKHFTGSSAFPTTSRRQIWNRNCSYSPCGPCPTRRGRFCEQQWSGCVTWCQVRGGAPHLHLFFSGECCCTQDSPARKSGVAVSTELNPQVADLGGTLGLFLGFSFLGLFDALVDISSNAVNITRQKIIFLVKN